MNQNEAIVHEERSLKRASWWGAKKRIRRIRTSRIVFREENRDDKMYNRVLWCKSFSIISSFPSSLGESLPKQGKPDPHPFLEFMRQRTGREREGKRWAQHGRWGQRQSYNIEIDEWPYISGINKMKYAHFRDKRRQKKLKWRCLETNESCYPSLRIPWSFNDTLHAYSQPVKNPVDFPFPERHKKDEHAKDLVHVCILNLLQTEQATWLSIWIFLLNLMTWYQMNGRDLPFPSSSPAHTILWWDHFLPKTHFLFCHTREKQLASCLLFKKEILPNEATRRGWFHILSTYSNEFGRFRTRLGRKHITSWRKQDPGNILSCLLSLKSRYQVSGLLFVYLHHMLLIN